LKSTLALKIRSEGREIRWKEELSRNTCRKRFRLQCQAKLIK
jgi:hypothetical protein